MTRPCWRPVQSWYFIAAVICLHVIASCLAEDREKRNIADTTSSIVDVNKVSKLLSDIAAAGKTVKDALAKAWRTISNLKLFNRKNKQAADDTTL